jgi:hypothetical protein
MKMNLGLALLTLVAFTAAHAQDATAPAAASTPPPAKKVSKASKKHKKQKKALKSAELPNVNVPAAASSEKEASTRPDGSGANASAETVLETTSPEKPKVTSGTAPAKAADIDDEITNARMRATTGAKSRFSFQSAINYNGGSVAKPISPDRPKLSPGTILQDPANLQALVSAKYRISTHDNLNLGLGLQWNNPYHAAGYTDRGQAADPYLQYSRVFKFSQIQNVLNVGFTKYTRRNARLAKDIGESDVDHTFLWAVGKSGLQLGMNLAWTHDFYSTNLNSADNAIDELAAFPFLEQELGSVFSFRTVYRGFTYFNSQADSSFIRDTVSQSAGIGIAISRDFYLYPNVQWLWSHMEARKTNIAISANINL